MRSFKDKEWQKATPDAQVEKSIREGKKGTLMASFEKQFSPEEIKALVAYVRKLGGVPQVGCGGPAVGSRSAAETKASARHPAAPRRRS